MPSGSIEAVKDSLVRWLKSSRFADALADADALAVAEGRDDGTRPTPVPPPDAIFPCEKLSLANYPAVELQGLAVTYASDTEALMREQRIAVVFTQVGDDEATVTRDIERLVEAAVRLLRGSVLDTRDGLRGIQVESEDYSELTPGAGTFMKGGRVLLLAPTYT